MRNSTQSTSILDINGSPGIPHKIAVRLPKLFGNLVIYILVFLIVYYLKYKHLHITTVHWNFSIIYLIAWAAGGLISGKFRFQSVTTIQSCLNKCYTSLLISLGVAAFLLAEFESISISRMVVIASFFSALPVEVAFFWYKNKSKLITDSKPKKPVSFRAPLIDLLILTVTLLLLYRYKFNLGNLNENHIVLLSGSYLSWLLAAFITHQFQPFSEKSDVWNAISIQLKFYLLIFALMSFLVYLLQIEQYYRTFYLAAIIVYAFISFLAMLFLYIDKLPQKTDDVTTDFLHAFEIKDPAVPEKERKIINSKYKLCGDVKNESQLKQKLELIYFKEHPEVFSFIERKLDLSTFEIDKTTVLKSRDPYNITVFPQNYLELFINIHKINDIRLINEYFTEVNNRLCRGGIFVGNFEPIRFRYDRFRAKYPFFLANTLYFIDFLWKRVTPKLPIVSKIYFIFSRGQDRALPLAEGLGRLYFCGFEVIDLKVINNLCYFVAKKVSEPSRDDHPSYSPIIKMKREGKNSKPVYVYKLRTMHPYSEYLQEFIYYNNHLEIGGKFKDDFRIPKWGAVFRKLFLDELPMIVNILKGDLKFVGVRPISKQYLSLYDEEFRKRRCKYKPGLIPPYYADLPKGINEIIQSEKKYLDEYDAHKIKTDVKYFFKAFINIAFHNQRSG